LPGSGPVLQRVGHSSTSRRKKRPKRRGEVPNNFFLNPGKKGREIKKKSAWAPPYQGVGKKGKKREQKKEQQKGAKKTAQTATPFPRLP